MGNTAAHGRVELGLRYSFEERRVVIDQNQEFHENKLITKCRFRRAPNDVWAEPQKETTMFAQFRTRFNGPAAALLLLAALATARDSLAQPNPWGGKKGPGQYADVNGIKLYYEIHGVGKPLVLLHGGLGAGSMFGPVLPALAAKHRVILVDLQGHGRTADIDRPLDIRFMADDIAALIRHLDLGPTDIMGYSLGGGVALQTAIRHPGVVDRLVVASAPFRRDGFYPDILKQQEQVNANAVQFMNETPMYQLYQAVAPRPQEFGRLLDKIGEAMKHDFSVADD